jgi:hypothetical protein
MRRAKLVDEHGDELLNTKRAVELWNRVLGLPGEAGLTRPLTEDKLRELVRDGSLKRAGINVQTPPGRYYVGRRSLLRYIHEQCRATCERVEKELDDPEEDARNGA